MLQTEQEFTRILRSRLEGTLPEEELNDIVSDYAEHFRIGKADGRSEEELFRSLGSPEDVAREIRATHLVKQAEDVKSCKNIFHAVLATLGLGLFNLVFVLIPFILLVVLLMVVFILGIMFAIFGPAAFIYSVLQILGIPAFAIWQSPVAGVFFSIGITTFGLLLVIGDYYLARFFYRIGIQYLKWNIAVIAGTEEES
ncbi:MAG: DUF1700 domain-containing protein [Methanoregula sp.]|jgi:uncharacterized membrane protein|uniref:HAAS signaling domain-containing protein n=1 Tax=Methanoregula sp. TaxID=2052170 RepID=UPI0025F47085|nr:DUF1700 domain-containing protein [Methanoregula sp.]MCK9631670.1 DUF1700 domain-containing protein [Methanoregula sp.]